jgi:hypothetical protein
MPMQPNAIAWLDAHATQVVFQAISPGRRTKNRVLLQYRGHDGQTQAVGGASLGQAVWRAILRSREPSPAAQTESNRKETSL